MCPDRHTPSRRRRPVNRVLNGLPGDHLNGARRVWGRSSDPDSCADDTVSFASRQSGNSRLTMRSDGTRSLCSHMVGPENVGAHKCAWIRSISEEDVIVCPLTHVPRVKRLRRNVRVIPLHAHVGLR